MINMENKPKPLLILASVLINGLCIIAVIYAIHSNRTFKDFSMHSLFVGIPFLLFGLITIISSIEEFKFPKDAIIFLLGLPVLILIAFIGGSLFYSLGVLFTFLYSAFYQWLQRPSISYTWKFVAIATLASTFGTAFFYFRLKIRITYGLTECAFGLVAAINRIPQESSKETNNAFYFAILTASIYLIVRGLDNIHQGIKNKSDPFALNIFALLTRLKNRNVKANQ